MGTVSNDASIVETPDGNQFVVEIWKPSWGEGVDFWDSLALAAWSLVSPGWRINIKRFPVRGRKAIYRERAGSWEEAQRRLEVLAADLRRTGTLPVGPPRSS